MRSFNLEDIDQFIYKVLVYREIHRSVFEFNSKNRLLTLQVDNNDRVSFEKSKSMVDVFTNAMRSKGMAIPKDMIVGLVLTKGKYVFIGLSMKALDEGEKIKIPIYLAGDITIAVRTLDEIRDEMKFLLKKKYNWYYGMWNDYDHLQGSLFKLKRSTI